MSLAASFNAPAGYWLTRGGRMLAISGMDTVHLRNTVELVRRYLLATAASPSEIQWPGLGAPGDVKYGELLEELNRRSPSRGIS